VLDTSEPRIAATESGSSGDWPTPRSSENEQRTRRTQPSVADGHGNILAAEVLREWPTPTWKDHAESGAAGYSTASGRHSGTTLTDATVRTWPTATQRDWKDGACRDANIPTNGLLGRAVPRMTGNSRARLNPQWVAQLMGFPHDWLRPDGVTNSAPSATPSAPRSSK